jgi:hypothetical protein
MVHADLEALERFVDASARSCRSLQHARLLGRKLAQLLERGKFDALFLADVLGVYDYRNKAVK